MRSPSNAHQSPCHQPVFSEGFRHLLTTAPGPVNFATSPNKSDSGDLFLCGHFVAIIQPHSPGEQRAMADEERIRVAVRVRPRQKYDPLDATEGTVSGDPPSLEVRALLSQLYKRKTSVASTLCTTETQRCRTISSHPTHDRTLKVSPRMSPLNSLLIAQLTVRCHTPKVGGKKYGFGSVFGDATTQREIYAACGAPALDAVLRGLDACVFAFGRTGAGKTYTMLGPAGGRPESGRAQRDEVGIVPRAAVDLFRRIARLTSDAEGAIGHAGCTGYRVRVSYVEVHREAIFDLLHPSGRAALSTAAIGEFIACATK